MFARLDHSHCDSAAPLADRLGLCCGDNRTTQNLFDMYYMTCTFTFSAVSIQCPRRDARCGSGLTLVPHPHPALPPQRLRQPPQPSSAPPRRRACRKQAREIMEHQSRSATEASKPPAHGRHRGRERRGQSTTQAHLFRSIFLSASCEPCDLKTRPMRTRARARRCRTACRCSRRACTIHVQSTS